MPKKLLIKTGTYQKDGETKNRYTQLGVILENENGEYALLDPSVNLAGCLLQQNAMGGEPRKNVMVSVFQQDEQHQPQQQAYQQPAPAAAPPATPQNGAPSHDPFKDDIPF